MYWWLVFFLEYGEIGDTRCVSLAVTSESAQAANLDKPAGYGNVGRTELLFLAGSSFTGPTGLHDNVPADLLPRWHKQSASLVQINPDALTSQIGG